MNPKIQRSIYMESTNKSRTLFILNQGAWMGLSLAAFSYLRYLMGMMQSSAAELFSWAIYGAFVYYTIKLYRDRYLGGFIGYGKALWAGTRTGLWAGIVLGAYLFIFLKFIDPAYMDELIATAQEAYLQSGMSAAQVENLDDVIRMSTSPTVMIISGTLSVGFGAFIFSLVISAFMKKEGDPFQQIMSNVE